MKYHIYTVVPIVTSPILSHLEHNQPPWPLAVPHHHHHLPGLVAVHHVGGVVQPRLKITNYCATKIN